MRSPTKQGGERQIARGQRLGGGDGVRLDAHRLGGEPGAGAPVAGDHLVEHQQHVVLAADALHLRPIAGGRDLDAARSLDRLADEGRDVVRPRFEDRLLHRAGGAQAEIVVALAGQLELEGIGHHHVDDVGHRAVQLAVHAFHAAERGAGDGRAVIGHLARDDAVLLGLALERPVVPDEADGGVVRFGPGGAEEDLAEAGRRNLGDLAGEQHGAGRRAAEEGVVVGQLLHLPVGGLGELLAAVADIDAPQARHAVEDLVALAVVDEGTVGADDHAAAGAAQVLVVGEGVEMVRGVDRLQLFQRVVHGGHRESPCG